MTCPFAFLDPEYAQTSYRTALVYDRACELHESGSAHPECPDRVKLPLKHLRYCGIIDKFTWLGSVEACSRERLKLAHDDAYVEKMILKLEKYRSLVFDADNSPREEVLSNDGADALLDSCLCDLEKSEDRNSQNSDVHEEKPSVHVDLDRYSESIACPQDIYFNEHTLNAVLHAAGGAVQAALSVANGAVDNGLCLLRPPGHHAGPNSASGFCIFNNVAVAARTLQRETANIKKIVIFDWDVHHGDGTEKIFYDDPSVLCISIHQYARGHPHRFHRRSTKYRMEDTFKILTKDNDDSCDMEKISVEEGQGVSKVPENSANDGKGPSSEKDDDSVPVLSESIGETPSVLDGSKRARREHAKVDYAQLEAKLRREAATDRGYTEQNRQGEFSKFITDPSQTILEGTAGEGEESEEESYNPEDYEELSDSSLSGSDDYYDSSTPDFYPGTGHIEDIGTGVGRGQNVNIPLPCHGFGDLEYCALMNALILPLIQDFNPDFILIAGGFDAVRHDTLGSMQLTPSGYAMMTKMLMNALPHGRVLCVLEGGYNVPQVSLCVESVARTLLGSTGSERSRLLLHRSVNLIREIREALVNDKGNSDSLSANKRSKPDILQIRSGSF